MDLLKSLIALNHQQPRPHPDVFNDRPAAVNEVYVDALQPPPRPHENRIENDNSIAATNGAAPWQNGDLEVYGIEEWDQKQQLLGHIRTTRPSTKFSYQPPIPATPIALPKTRTSEHIIRLHQLCQERGILTQYEFSSEYGDAKWSVRLTLGETIIEEDGPFQSKKEAKDVAAEKGCLLITEMPIPAASAKRRLDDSPGENWVGLLLEFCNATSIPHPLYQDYQVGPVFASEVLIRTRLGHAFGGPTLTFPTKKLAKANAAREAVLWLRETGHIDPTSSTITKKKIKLAHTDAGATQGQGDGLKAKPAASYAQQVNDFCPKLGLGPPDYKLTASPAAPGFHSGFAVFPHDPCIRGPIGEVRNVYGKKAAREECAKQVLAYLEEEAERRGAIMRAIREQGRVNINIERRTFIAD